MKKGVCASELADLIRKEDFWDSGREQLGFFFNIKLNCGRRWLSDVEEFCQVCFIDAWKGKNLNLLIQNFPFAMQVKMCSEKIKSEDEFEFRLKPQHLVKSFIHRLLHHYGLDFDLSPQSTYLTYHNEKQMLFTTSELRYGIRAWTTTSYTSILGFLFYLSILFFP